MTYQYNFFILQEKVHNTVPTQSNKRHKDPTQFTAHSKTSFTLQSTHRAVQSIYRVPPDCRRL